MRCFAFHFLPTGLLISVAVTLQLPDLQPFLSALPNLVQDYIPQALQNDTAHELLKRQTSNACPTDFRSCANLGAPQLCCMSNAVCSADYAGHVACCPSGAACTGTITGIVSSGTMNGNGVVVGGGAAATGTSNAGSVGGSSATTTSFEFASSTQSNNGLVAASTQGTVATNNGATTGNGFIVAGSSTVATPGAGVRTADIPCAIRIAIRLLDYLPF
ncbi:hypothetical protein DOTSEDRAFT_58910 [Dothistroma septosporum NZE10]|uniref:Hydrophobin-like protein n=1 Tax=Dothistroma septosporum (strain NZE10 / CBS 128990) TaxID=675120 RepID=N1Q4U3_DOTSN|nr:hypothetical protein DOTSEDRAFT_58910 [Dothistroma septosporum NZE10]